MITIRHANDRGQTGTDWLESFHTFSFAEYHDPNHMHFRSLRVINEDVIQAGKGFGTHPHRDMEIITYVIQGSLEHKDSMGTGSVIRPGEIQKMSAGTGVTHSEFNHSKTQALHLLQIWIVPKQTGLKPSYEQITIPKNINNEFILVGSSDGRDHSITIQQDVSLSVLYLEPNKTANYRLNANRAAWIQIVSGNLTVNGHPLSSGDGAAITNESTITIESNQASELLLFDLF